MLTPPQIVKSISVQGKVKNQSSSKNSVPEYMTIKEMQTHAMPKEMALQVLNEVDIHG